MCERFHEQMSVLEKMQEKVPVECALGSLIASANPYLQDAQGALYFGSVGGDPAEISVADIRMEEDNKYQTEWTFKGQSQKIAKAIRIEYRYPKMGLNGKPYMAIDYLLVGYEGSGAG